MAIGTGNAGGRPAPLAATTTVVAAVLVALTVLALAAPAWWVDADRAVVDSWHGAVAGSPASGFFDAFATVSSPLYVRVVILLLAAVLLVTRRPRLALFSVVTMCVSWAGWAGLKELVARERPQVVDQISGYAFPSGHATDNAAAAAVAVAVVLALIRPGAVRVGAGVTGVLWCLVVGVDRVMVGAHHPSDVVAGWSLGLLVALIAFLATGVSARPAVLPHEEPPRSSLPERHRTLAVVLNPIKVGSASEFRSRVASAAREAGWDEPLWFETTVDDAGASMARAAVAAGADVVVAAGGDGTVRVVCAEMAGSGVPVGILPAGTGNLLARNLDLPLSFEDAILTILHGQDRAVDVVRVEGDDLEPTRFMVMGGMGLDAAIMEGAPDDLKKKIGWTAYFVAGFRHLSDPSIKVQISVDGGPPVTRRANTIVVGNVGTLTAGIPLLPDARIDDGVLDVVVVAPRRFLGWITVVARVLSRHRGTDEVLDRFTGRSVVIRSERPTARQLDGDSLPVGHEIHAENEHGVLLVRVPR